jgi:hypothetical protein
MEEARRELLSRMYLIWKDVKELTFEVVKDINRQFEEALEEVARTRGIQMEVLRTEVLRCDR